MAVYAALYAASYISARISLYAVSGILLMAAALWLFMKDAAKAGSAVQLRALFSLSLVGGQGVSALKLSHLQTDWLPETWLVLFLAEVCFWYAFEAAFRLRESRTGRGADMKAASGAAGSAGEAAQGPVSIRSGRLLFSIAGITAVSYAAFFLEARILGFVPLFLRGVPHAYSYFHVSGLHYFTVSCIMVPALSVVWSFTAEKKSLPQRAAAVLCTLLSILIPVLCVSRFQLILSVGLALATFASASGQERRLRPQALALVFAVLAALYVLLSFARSHSVSYLNGIFEMKYELPIFITQPYIYIANNYDNLNCLVRDLPRHANGIRQLYPFFALTGLKFRFPELVLLPIYVTKEELTTVTILYDAWYDFGIIGTALFSAVLGAVSGILESVTRGRHHPLTGVLYAFLAVYLVLAFFTTWFSNPATWFYFAELLAVRLFVGGAAYGPDVSDLKGEQV